MESDFENPYADAVAWEDVQRREVHEDQAWVPPRSRHVLATRVQLVLVALTCIVGGIAAVIDIESIMVSGAVLCCLCAMLFLHDWRCRSLGHQPNGWVRCVAATGLLFVVVVFGLIAGNGWSPLIADRVGVDEGCCLYAFLTIIATCLAYRRRPGTTLDY